MKKYFKQGEHSGFTMDAIKGTKGVEATFFDAYEQQFLDMKRIDDTILIGMQLLLVGKQSLFDPKAGGREQLIQIGSGAGAIIEKKYIPSPYAVYYHSVMHLFNLMINDLDKLNPLLKKRISEDWKSVQDAPLDTRDTYNKVSKLFRNLKRVINHRYGEPEPIIDIIDHRILDRIMAEKQAAKEAKK